MSCRTFLNVFFVSFLTTGSAYAGIIGDINGIKADSSGPYLWGWACDKGYNTSITIHLYVGGPSGTGKAIKSLVASESGEAAINQACQTSGVAHRFKIPLSSDIQRAYAGQPIYIHGIAPSKTGNLLISRSGQFVIPAPPPLPALPAGVPATSSSRDACFLPGELAAWDKEIDKSRIALSACSTGVIAPQKKITSYSIYVPNSGGSVVDCASTRENEKHSRFIDNYVKELVSLADSSPRTVSGNNTQCLVNTLYTWAKADAMMEINSAGTPEQAKYDRMWTMAAVASTYLKNDHIQKRAVNQVVSKSNKDAVIKQWLYKLAVQVSNEVEVDRRAGFENNHQYWRGFGLLSVAFLNQNEALYKQSKKIFETAMNEIIDDSNVPSDDHGFLMPELGRRSKALSYHGFASLPILGMAWYSQAYGCDFTTSSWRKNQLTRLVRKTIQGHYNKQVFTDEIYRRYNLKNITQSNSDYRKLMYLASQVDPQIGKEVQSFLKRTENASISTEYGKSSSENRLGGKFEITAKALAPMKSARGMPFSSCAK